MLFHYLTPGSVFFWDIRLQHAMFTESTQRNHFKSMTCSNTNSKYELSLLLDSTRAGAKTRCVRKLDNTRWLTNLYSGVSDIKDTCYYYFGHIVRHQSMFCISDALHQPKHYDATCQNKIKYFFVSCKLYFFLNRHKEEKSLRSLL